MMDAAQLHTQYNDLISAVLRQLPDPGLRVLFRREADPFFRQCALSVWHAGGRTITPGYAEWYNALFSGDSAPGDLLFWDLVGQADRAGPLPQPPFFARMVRYDKETGRGVSRRFLQTLSLVLVLLAGLDGTVRAEEIAVIQAYLDGLSAQCDQEGLAGDRTRWDLNRYITPSQSEKPAPQAAAEQESPAPQASSQPEQEAQEPSLEELLAELDELCGLDQVKKEVHSLINLVKVRRLREEAGLPAPPLSLHMVFQGNPGTGKTTVARLLARLYRAIGVLSKGQLVEVDRAGLVAGFVGQTALKTKEVVQSALGGILFIDEAYSLAPDSPSDFGREAIEVLLKEMEDHRKDLVVIVAGYTNLMEKFIHSNPGLESRFNKYLTFADYNGDQLMEIFESLCRKNGYALSKAAREKAAGGFTALFAGRDENFGNARDVRNCFEQSVSRQADRVAGLEAPAKEDLMALLPEDLGEE